MDEDMFEASLAQLLYNVNQVNGPPRYITVHSSREPLDVSGKIKYSSKLKPNEVEFTWRVTL